ncbi:hypothetical protein FHETE_600 [Fusarium heterosporum]|uniref:Uncharacterized protein n=1 Tax=Fusarium heterosporum TaxID=42747 RepID=A0A8H5X1P4_FUSHE|nr:hypothetical protein FHETE_600 [Fusarium heterosporum]
MPNELPPSDRNYDTRVTKSESETPELQHKLDFDNRLVTIAVSDLDRIKHMLEAPDALPSLAVAPSSTMMGGRYGNFDHATSWKISQNKDSLLWKQDRQHSGRAEASPQPPVAAAYHDIPSPKYPPFDLARQISARRQVLEAQARDVEHALHAGNPEKRQPQIYPATAEQKVLFDRLDVAQLRLRMLVLRAGRSCLLFSQNGKFSEL